MIDMQQKFCSSDDGLALAYRDYPGPDNTQPPIICLHGLTRTCRDFEALAPWLSQDRRVLAPDFRGRGHSERDSNYHNYHPMRYAQDTLTILDTEQIDCAVFVGTSLGGLVTMGLAQANPERVAAVVLNDVGTHLSPIGIQRIAGYVGKIYPVINWSDAAAQQKRLYEQALPDYSFADWQAYARRGYRENDEGIPVADSDPNIARAIEVGSTASLDPITAFSCLQNIPTLLVRGAHSDILAPETVESMMETKSDLQFVEIPNRGHAPTLDEPEARAALNHFLSMIEPTDPT